MIDFLSKLQFKRDKSLIGFAALLVALTGVGIWHHDITAKEGIAFLGGALALPGLFGRASEEEKKDSQ